MRKPVIKSLIYYISIIILLISCQKKFLCPDCTDNKPPVAKAGGDQIIILPADSTTLQGDASTDADGTISLYKWIKISGPVPIIITKPDSSNTSIKTLVQGVYQVELTITDNGGLSAKDTIQITVNGSPVNQFPIANAGNDQEIVLPVNTAIINGSQSYDPDSSVISYYWSQIEGPDQATIESPGKVITGISNLVSGSYRFQLTVTDNGGLSAKDTIQIILDGPAINKSPVVNAGNDQQITSPANSSIVNGSKSYDPDGSIISYKWSQIAGPGQASIESPSAVVTGVSNLVSGNYLFLLTVTDNDSLSAKDTVAIYVGLSSCSAINLSWSLDSITGMMALINPSIAPYPATLNCGYGPESLIPALYDVTIQFEGSSIVRHLVFVPRANVNNTTIDIFLSSILYIDPNDGEVSIPVIYARTDSGIDFTKKVTVTNTK